MAAKAAMTDVRVGLAELYSNRSFIKINNTGLSLGYCINESYTTEVTLSGADGFTFTPATGYFYICNKEFANYEAAKTLAEELKGYGLHAYPCSVYRNTWLVYLGGTDKTTARAERALAVAKTEYSFDILTFDNSERLLISGEPDTILIDAGIEGAYPQFKATEANGIGVYAVNLGERSYRGRIEIGRYGKKTLTAVNIVNVESYLYSVVACEMVSSWHSEALKAQAVCSRSYALTKTGYSADCDLTRPYILEDSINSQVYKGVGYETQAARRAVIETLGETVTHKGQTIMAFFFSTSGGATENMEDVWGMSRDYLKSVPDRYENLPEVQPWIVSLTRKQIEDNLKKAGYSTGSLVSISPVNISETGRVSLLEMKGEKGGAMLQTDAIRSILGLLSTKFKIVKYGDIPDMVSIVGGRGSINERISNCYFLDGSGRVQAAAGLQQQYIVQSADNFTNFPAAAPTSPDSFFFAGMGWGHGIGMSQSGARGMAEAGFGYKEILEYYFTGCLVK